MSDKAAKEYRENKVINGVIVRGESLEEWLAKENGKIRPELDKINQNSSYQSPLNDYASDMSGRMEKFINKLSEDMAKIEKIHKSRGKVD